MVGSHWRVVLDLLHRNFVLTYISFECFSENRIERFPHLNSELSNANRMRHDEFEPPKPTCRVLGLHLGRELEILRHSLKEQCALLQERF